MFTVYDGLLPNQSLCPRTMRDIMYIEPTLQGQPPSYSHLVANWSQHTGKASKEHDEVRVEHSFASRCLRFTMVSMRLVESAHCAEGKDTRRTWTH